MTKSVVALLVTAISLLGQNISGTWQGTLAPPDRPALRIVVKFTRAADESLKADFYSIDQTGQPFPASAATQQGSNVKLTIPSVGGVYEGKLAADGNSITGTFTQGAPLPLNLVKEIGRAHV